MKKLVTILVVFAIVLAAMISEIVFVNSFYSGLQHDLERVSESILMHEEHVDNEETVELCKAVADKWEKGKKKLLLLQNHNTVRNFDDKIVSLYAVVKTDNFNDAVIFVQSAINYIDDVLLDSIPYLSNIL
ncbi:MAG: DUF4363 family protein [Clostridiales bacterium]|nr:DUF4363 family protein [Clostridiales bacterium]